MNTGIITSSPVGEERPLVVDEPPTKRNSCGTRKGNLTTLFLSTVPAVVSLTTSAIALFALCPDRSDTAKALAITGLATGIFSFGSSWVSCCCLEPSPCLAFLGLTVGVTGITLGAVGSAGISLCS